MTKNEFMVVIVLWFMVSVYFLLFGAGNLVQFFALFSMCMSLVIGFRVAMERV